MSDPLVHNLLILAGLLFGLGLVGVLTSRSSQDAARHFTTLCVAVGLALLVVSRRHGGAGLDLLAWVLTAGAGCVLWQHSTLVWKSATSRQESTVATEARRSASEDRR